MSSVSTRSLKLLAALTWYVGGVVLLLKGISLAREAIAMERQQIWMWAAIFVGVVAGLIKARFIFERSCRNNISRIDTLERRRIWLFFKPKFFVALLAMIVAGATLSRWAHGSYPFLISVAALDLALATALLISSRVYWTEKVFVK